MAIPKGFRSGSGFGRGFGRLPVGTPGIAFRPDVSAVVRLAKDVEGKFRGGAFQHALADAHLSMAEKMQDMVVDELRKAKSPRPQRREKWLERSITHEQNRLVNANGFLVGRPPWLNQSMAGLYWRRIEEGGPNPMAAMGKIIGSFYVPGGPHRPGPAQAHGRLLGWGTPARGGWTVQAADAASEGYHMHREARGRFLAANVILPTYKAAFATYGLNFVELYRKQYGVRPTQAGILGGGR